ncbi:MAG TPA: Crp/Fnr family transcriptional regulator, partial [Mycobacterium sp.]|nr:Crp/Fnr family transcriptional regulator [Mycobacterium sp.]
VFWREESIYAQGEPGEGLYIIVSGKVKLSRHLADGRQQVVVVGPSDIFGASSALDGAPRTATATSITDVAAVCMERDTIRALLVESPAVAEHLLRLLARRLRRTDDDLIDLFCTDGAGRVARWLLQLAARFGTYDGGELRVTLDVTQADIALLIAWARNGE